MSSDLAVATPAKKPGKGRNFWLSFTAVVVCNFLSALDLAGVSTALPTITDELNGGDKFVWVGAAYGLAAAAVIPCTGRLADILGRKPVLLTCVFFFFLGSALAGSAQNMNWLIGARGPQDTLHWSGHTLTRAYMLQPCRVSEAAVSSTSRSLSSPTSCLSLNVGYIKAS